MGYGFAQRARTDAAISEDNVFHTREGSDMLDTTSNPSGRIICSSGAGHLFRGDPQTSVAAVVIVVPVTRSPRLIKYLRYSRAVH